MNQLNTNVELYSSLRDILNNPLITEQLTPEEIKVGEYLRQDFERSGIHMDPQTRKLCYYNARNIVVGISIWKPDKWAKIILVSGDSCRVGKH